MMADAILYICTTCRRGTSEQPCPGARMLDAIEALETLPNIEIRGVECLSACNQGCAVALAAPGKWTYIYAGLDPALHAPDILRGAMLYARSADGIPPWRERPEIFRKNVIARTPPIAHSLIARPLQD
jgi:predicted metal-binding protein